MAASGSKCRSLTVWSAVRPSVRLSSPNWSTRDRRGYFIYELRPEDGPLRSTFEARVLYMTAADRVGYVMRWEFWRALTCEPVLRVDRAASGRGRFLDGANYYRVRRHVLRSNFSLKFRMIDQWPPVVRRTVLNTVPPMMHNFLPLS